MFRVSGRKLIKALYLFLMKHIFFVTILFFSMTAFSQFAPPVSQSGTNAVYKDSSAFIGWANNCNIVRGLQDISSPANGYANVGDNLSALGMAGTTGIVSLGDGGSATLQFNRPVIDGVGADLAVFENSFDDTFLELAFVEVSSDGIHFFRFPATSNTDTIIQTNSFGSTDATKINNLAGKYRGQYGTPFDLADIADTILLDKQAITHVKIIDVVGCIQNQYCSRDVNHHKINDPWPTGFGSGGFDLDAVGIIHQQAVGIEELELMPITIFPNPATDVLHITIASNDFYSVFITNLMGQKVLEVNKQLNTSLLLVNELKQGIYFLTITNEGTQKQVRFVKL
jgi:hypothetical protein